MAKAYGEMLWTVALTAQLARARELAKASELISPRSVACCSLVTRTKAVRSTALKEMRQAAKTATATPK
eukprot:scaffold4779_cov116-Isochrysis_galbana.AAC.4